MRDLADELDLNENAGDLVAIPISGRDWHFKRGANEFRIAYLQAGGVEGIMAFLESSIVDDERLDFMRMLTSFNELSAEKFAKLVNRIVEIVADRPTSSPPASRPAATKRTSNQRSKGGSSSARGRAARR